MASDWLSYIEGARRRARHLGFVCAVWAGYGVTLLMWRQEPGGVLVEAPDLAPSNDNAFFAPGPA